MTSRVSSSDPPAPGPVAQTLRDKLAAAFDPPVLDVINESHMHAVPVGSERHFRVVIVSRRFEGQPRLARHRSVYAALTHELDNDVHALSIDAFTAVEWSERAGTTQPSPPCRGGG